MAIGGVGAAVMASGGGAFALLGTALTVVLWIVGVVVLLALAASLLLGVAVGAGHLVRRLRR